MTLIDALRNFLVNRLYGPLAGIDRRSHVVPAAASAISREHGHANIPLDEARYGESLLARDGGRFASLGLANRTVASRRRSKALLNNSPICTNSRHLNKDAERGKTLQYVGAWRCPITSNARAIAIFAAEEQLDRSEGLCRLPSANIDKLKVIGLFCVNSRLWQRV